MKRRICLSLMAACLLFTGCSASVAQPPEKSADPGVSLAEETPISQAQAGVTFASWSEAEMKSAVEQLRSLGVLTEADCTEKALSSPVTRGQFITLLVKALALPVTDRSDGVLQETAYAPYVQAGYSAGLFTGNETAMSFTPTDGFFMAERGYAEMDAPMSRYDMAVLFANVLPGEGGAQTFQDQAWLVRQNETVQRAVFLAVERGVLAVCEDGAFHGDSGMTLAQTAASLCRLLGCEPVVPGAEPVAALSPVETLRKSRRVIHAGGRYLCADGKVRSYTNSAEALVNAYRTGERVVEFDLTTTTDGHWVCIHDWLNDFSETIQNGEALSLAEWMNTELRGSLTPMCVESLVGFLREHPDLYIVTDVKGDEVAAIQALAQIGPDVKDRFIIQIYKESEYDPVKECGFPNIIYTLYNLDKADKMDFDRLTAFAATHPLVGYTYPLTYFQAEGYHEGMAKTGVPLFVHTVNGTEAQEACYAAGITAVYTDDVG